MVWSRMPDEALVLRAQRGDDLAMRALVLRYERPLRAHSAFFFAAGQTHDDLRQEALIGLWGAVRNYRADRAVGKFKSFADLCIRRQLVTALKLSKRDKHRPLNEAILLSTPATRPSAGEASADDLRLADVIADPIADPHLEFLARQDFDLVRETIIHGLTDLERAVLIGIVNGSSQLDLQAALGFDFNTWADGRPRAKVVENALQRAQKKIEIALETGTVRHIRRRKAWTVDERRALSSAMRERRAA